MTDVLDGIITKVAAAIRGRDATGSRLARDPYQMGIQTSADYVTGKVLLDPPETRQLLEIFGGNTEIALRVLRERLDTSAARLLPEGAGGLSIRSGVGPGESKDLALYTTPLYDSRYYQQNK